MTHVLLFFSNVVLKTFSPFLFLSNFYAERSRLGFAQDYPAARVRLEAIAAKKLEKYKKVPLEKGL